MAYRRKRGATARRPIRRRRVMKRMARPMRSLIPQINMKRTFYYDTWSPNSASTNGFWRQLSIRFDQIPNNTELSAVFGQYKLNAVKFAMIPSFSEFDGSQEQQTSPVITPMAHVWVCYDKYTTTTPSGVYSVTTLNNFMEQGQIKTVKDSNKLINIYQKSPTYAGWDASAGTYTKLKAASWQRTDGGTGVTHNAAQVFINTSDANLPATNVYQIICTVYLSLKNQR